MSFEDNEWILNNLASKGRNLGPPRPIDFEHLFPDVSSAQAFANEAQREGFLVKVWEYDAEEGSWNATASKVMVPTCKDITETEELLGAIARMHGGHSDGWGFFDP